MQFSASDKCDAPSDLPLSFRLNRCPGQPILVLVIKFLPALRPTNALVRVYSRIDHLAPESYFPLYFLGRTIERETFILSPPLLNA